jgi:hypothetical protein
VSGSIVDPIQNYTWSLSDDLAHGNSNTARAVYSIGGTYDLILRTDTEFGSYKITIYDNAFDIVEKIKSKSLSSKKKDDVEFLTNNLRMTICELG